MTKVDVLSILVLFGFTFLGFCLGFCLKFTNLVFDWFERKVLGDE